MRDPVQCEAIYVECFANCLGRREVEELYRYVQPAAISFLSLLNIRKKIKRISTCVCISKTVVISEIETDVRVRSLKIMNHISDGQSRCERESWDVPLTPPRSVQHHTLYL